MNAAQTQTQLDRKTANLDYRVMSCQHPRLRAALHFTGAAKQTPAPKAPRCVPTCQHPRLREALQFPRPAAPATPAAAKIDSPKNPIIFEQRPKVSREELSPGLLVVRKVLTVAFSGLALLMSPF
jgi:hypothetical protein